MEDKSAEQVVEERLASEEVLAEWGIPAARRYTRLSFAILAVVTLATVVGAIAYLVAGDPALVSLNFAGFALVVLLAAVVLSLRVFQLRAQRADVKCFIPALERELDGRPDHDVAAQQRLEETFDWKSRHFMYAIRMIALAMVVLVAVNTYQGGVVDFGRQLVFDGCIAIVVASFAWDQFAFRAELLLEELRARLAAQVRYQRLHAESVDDADNADSADAENV